MVWRAGCGAEALHLFYEERYECSGVLDACLGLLVEVGLVGRASSLGDAEETVLHALACLDVYLCWEVAFGVYLVIHVERGVLAVTKVVLRVGVIDAA